LAWLLHQGVTTSVIVGARNDAQLRDNLAASEVKISPAQLERLDRASALPPEYPGWMVTVQARDRLEAIPPERRFAKT
ncbi:MAG TPA: aldo/keto reductase, partial [Polyangia bacterium]|nr:aldo/keto reductase [Polyangia bacterium]